MPDRSKYKPSHGGRHGSNPNASRQARGNMVKIGSATYADAAIGKYGSAVSSLQTAKTQASILAGLSRPKGIPPINEAANIGGLVSRAQGLKGGATKTKSAGENLKGMKPKLPKTTYSNDDMSRMYWDNFLGGKLGKSDHQKEVDKRNKALNKKWKKLKKMYPAVAYTPSEAQQISDYSKLTKKQKELWRKQHPELAKKMYQNALHNYVKDPTTRTAVMSVASFGFYKKNPDLEYIKDYSGKKKPKIKGLTDDSEMRRIYKGSVEGAGYIGDIVDPTMIAGGAGVFIKGGKAVHAGTTIPKVTKVNPGKVNAIGDGALNVKAGPSVKGHTPGTKVKPETAVTGGKAAETGGKGIAAGSDAEKAAPTAPKHKADKPVKPETTPKSKDTKPTKQNSQTIQKEKEPRKSEPIKEEPKVNEPRKPEPIKEEPKVNEPRKPEPIKEEPRVNESRKPEPIKEEPRVNEPRKPEPIKEEPRVNEPRKPEPIKEEPRVNTSEKVIDIKPGQVVQPTVASSASSGRKIVDVKPRQSFNSANTYIDPLMGERIAGRDGSRTIGESLQNAENRFGSSVEDAHFSSNPHDRFATTSSSNTRVTVDRVEERIKANEEAIKAFEEQGIVINGDKLGSHGGKNIDVKKAKELNEEYKKAEKEIDRLKEEQRTLKEEQVKNYDEMIKHNEDQIKQIEDGSPMDGDKLGSHGGKNIDVKKAKELNEEYKKAQKEVDRLKEEQKTLKEKQVKNYDRVIKDQEARVKSANEDVNKFVEDNKLENIDPEKTSVKEIKDKNATYDKLHDKALEEQRKLDELKNKRNNLIEKEKPFEHSADDIFDNARRNAESNRPERPFADKANEFVDNARARVTIKEPEHFVSTDEIGRAIEHDNVIEMPKIKERSFPEPKRMAATEKDEAISFDDLDVVFKDTNLEKARANTPGSTAKPESKVQPEDLSDPILGERVRGRDGSRTVGENLRNGEKSGKNSFDEPYSRSSEHDRHPKAEESPESTTRPKDEQTQKPVKEEGEPSGKTPEKESQKNTLPSEESPNITEKDKKLFDELLGKDASGKKDLEVLKTDRSKTIKDIDKINERRFEIKQRRAELLDKLRQKYGDVGPNNNLEGDIKAYDPRVLNKEFLMDKLLGKGDFFADGRKWQAEYKELTGEKDLLDNIYWSKQDKLLDLDKKISSYDELPSSFEVSKQAPEDNVINIGDYRETIDSPSSYRQAATEKPVSYDDLDVIYKDEPVVNSKETITSVEKTGPSSKEVNPNQGSSKPTNDIPVTSERDEFVDLIDNLVDDPKLVNKAERVSEYEKTLDNYKGKFEKKYGHSYDEVSNGKVPEKELTPDEVKTADAIREKEVEISKAKEQVKQDAYEKGDWEDIDDYEHYDETLNDTNMPDDEISYDDLDIVYSNEPTRVTSTPRTPTDDLLETGERLKQEEQNIRNDFKNKFGHDLDDVASGKVPADKAEKEWADRFTKAIADDKKTFRRQNAEYRRLQETGERLKQEEQNIRNDFKNKFGHDLDDVASGRIPVDEVEKKWADKFTDAIDSDKAKLRELEEQVLGKERPKNGIQGEPSVEEILRHPGTEDIETPKVDLNDGKPVTDEIDFDGIPGAEPKATPERVANTPSEKSAKERFQETREKVQKRLEQDSIAKERRKTIKHKQDLVDSMEKDLVHEQHRLHKKYDADIPDDVQRKLEKQSADYEKEVIDLDKSKASFEKDYGVPYDKYKTLREEATEKAKTTVKEHPVKTSAAAGTGVGTAYWAATETFGGDSSTDTQTANTGNDEKHIIEEPDEEYEDVTEDIIEDTENETLEEDESSEIEETPTEPTSDGYSNYSDSTGGGSNSHSGGGSTHSGGNNKQPGKNKSEDKAKPEPKPEPKPESEPKPEPEVPEEPTTEPKEPIEETTEPEVTPIEPTPTETTVEPGQDNNSNSKETIIKDTNDSNSKHDSVTQKSKSNTKIKKSSSSSDYSKQDTEKSYVTKDNFDEESDDYEEIEDITEDITPEEELNEVPEVKEEPKVVEKEKPKKVEQESGKENHSSGIGKTAAVIGGTAAIVGGGIATGVAINKKKKEKEEDDEFGYASGSMYE